MIIVWDEPKRLANLDKHGLDFAGLTMDFFVSAVVSSAGKGRYQAIGALGGTVVSVIFAALGSEAISVISMRPANRKEREAPL